MALLIFIIIFFPFFSSVLLLYYSYHEFSLRTSVYLPSSISIMYNIALLSLSNTIHKCLHLVLVSANVTRSIVSLGVKTHNLSTKFSKDAHTVAPCVSINVHPL